MKINKLEVLLEFTLVAGVTYLLYRIQKKEELERHYQNIMTGVYQQAVRDL